jgi:hypothetical protein
MKVNITMIVNKKDSLKEETNLVKNKDLDKKDIKVKINNTIFVKDQTNLKKEKTNLIKRGEGTTNYEESVSKVSGFCSNIIKSNLNKKLIEKNSIIKDLKKKHKKGRSNKIFNYILINILFYLYLLKIFNLFYVLIALMLH